MTAIFEINSWSWELTICCISIFTTLVYFCFGKTLKTPSEVPQCSTNSRQKGIFCPKNVIVCSEVAFLPVSVI